MRKYQLKAVLFLVFGFLILVQVSKAQNPVSLSMSVSPAKVAAGGKATARISASISGNWHMYSTTQGGGGPIPTRITVVDGVIKSAGAVSGSAPKREMDPNFGIITEFYAGSTSFSVPLVVDASAQPGTQNVEVKVRYQVCNDKLCLPPELSGSTAATRIISPWKL